MVLVLCRNCYNLLNVSLKLNLLRNRYPIYYKVYTNHLLSFQGNATFTGRNNFVQQGFLSTSAQAAFLPPERKKKKGSKKIKNEDAQNPAPDIVNEDVPAYHEDLIPLRSQFEEVYEINSERSDVPCMFHMEVASADLQTDKNALSEVDPSADTIDVQKLPELSVQQRKKKVNKNSQSTALTEEQLKEMAHTSKKLSLLMNLHSYMDVCLRLDQHEQAHKTVMFYVERGKRSQSFPEVDSIVVFNLLLKYAAKKGDLLYVKNLTKWIKSSDIPLDWQSYLFWIESVGRKRFTNVTQKKAEFEEVMQAMSEQGFPPEDIFIKSIPSKAQKEIVSKVFAMFVPTLELKQFAYPDGYVCKLLQNFDTVEPSLMESANNLGMSMEELQQLFFLQLSQESEQTISIKSIQNDDANDKTRFLREKLKEQEGLWRKTVVHSLQSRLQLLKQAATKQKTMNIYPYMKLFPIDTYVDLIMIEIRLLSQSSEYYGFGPNFLGKLLGVKVMTLYKTLLKQDKGNMKTMKSLYNQFLKYAVNPENTSFSPRQYWEHLLVSNNLEHFQDSIIDVWPHEVLCSIGKFMYDIIIKDIAINVNILDQKTKKVVSVPAFFCVNSPAKNKVHQQLQPHRIVSKLYRESGLDDLIFNVTVMPMLCPPLPWINIHSGGFLLSETPFIRIPENSMHFTVLKEQTPTQQLYPVFDSLNNVSMCPWIINKPVLDLIIQVFNEGGDLNLTVPLHPSSLPLPPFLKSDQSAEIKKTILKKRAVYKREKAEMYSLWCDALYKLSIANNFRDRVFWFPHNLDFRGRAYATPPHFNHLGSDLVRGILLFAKGRPLGKNGLDWLKIHLVNLTGIKKKEGNASRLAYANEIMPDILDSADQPFTGNGWWKESEEPWQTLACCIELAKAVRSENPETFVCHFPVHQDGTCNGLQHYAALGRDLEGAQQVNLTPSEKPQDVYSGVANRVEQERAKDADSGKEIAQILEGHINRKLIKQTVMTIVYGVTKFGARLQILKRLKEDTSFPAEHQWTASLYLVEKTFLSIGEIFQNTSLIQHWLTDCAGQISRVRGKTVEWITPLGLPVVQPYLKNVSGSSPETHFKIGLPNTMKQVNAFPPNFIHSLDSTHMMLTSLYCEREGVDFVSVHDCFWTHPSSVDMMNKVCREQFVALHQEPILEDLSEFLFQKFSVPESEIGITGKKCDIQKKQLNKTLLQVPKQGTLSLEDVLKSTYFFN